MIGVGIFLFLLAGFCIFLNRRWIAVHPFQPYYYNELSDVTCDADGNIYVIADSTRVVLKLSPTGEILDRIDLTEKGVTSAKKIITGGDGKIYIHDVEIDKGIRIACERIWKMDTDFRSVEMIKEIPAEENMVRPSVAGISPTDTGIRYLAKEQNEMISFIDGGTPEKVYAYEEAEAWVMYAAFTPDGEEMYYSTYNGNVYRYVDGKEDELLYASTDRKGSVPLNMCYCDGVLYVADIGARDIVLIDTSSGEVSNSAAEGETLERSIPYYVDGGDMILATGEFSLMICKDGVWEESWETQPCSSVKAMIVITWIAIIYSAIFLLIAVLLALRYFMLKATAYVRVAFLIFFGIAGLVTILLGSLFPEFTSQLIDQIFEKEMLAAAVTEEHIPEEAFLALDEPSDFMSEDYMAVKEAVLEVFDTEVEDSGSLYCVLYRVIDGTVTMTYSMEDICVVYPYNWEYEGTDMEDLMLTGTPHTYNSQDSSGSYLFVHYPIFGKDDSPIGFLEVGTDLNSVNERNKSIIVTLLLNVLAMTAVIIMGVAECLYFFKDRSVYRAAKAEAAGPVQLPPGIFRFIVFLIFLFTNLTCVILPLRSMQIAAEEPLFGLSPAMLAAIPISAEVFSGAVFSALGGKVIRTLGPKKSIFASSLLFTAGLLIRALPHILTLTIGSLLLGAGWGVLLIIVNVQIAELPEEEKDKGYAYYSVSSVSGINCGVVLGGFLVQWFNYTTIFLITGVISVALYFVCRKYLLDNMSEDETEEEEEVQDRGNALRFIFRPKIIGFFLLSMAPLLVCGYFLNYLFPIMGSDFGMSDSYISFAFMITGIIALLFGTPLTEMFTKRNLRAFGLAAAMFLYAEAFLGVAIRQDVPSILLALVLIGFADSFGIPLLTSYFTDLDEVEEYGYDRSFGVYSLFENGAQALASFVLGFIYNMGVRKGMLATVIGMIILAFLFLLSASIRKRGAKKEKTANE
ncbi:MAG: MFS transporter [Lachnospiraceae bacterium]|nr:MFS transporter [Lachnospiraceae bacterium]